MFCSHVRYVCIYVCMYVCMHVCTKSFLKTTTNSSCVCTHLANKADSDSDSDHLPDSRQTEEHWWTHACDKLQMVQNAAARVLTRTRKYEHISPVLSTLHWLPSKHRIDFKILLMTYKALNGLAPQYLSELLSHYSPSRPLRSQNSGHLIIPRISKSTAGGRSFSFLAPKLWNNLPNTVREADTLCQFKSRLKTHLFNLAYT